MTSQRAFILALLKSLIGVVKLFCHTPWLFLA